MNSLLSGSPVSFLSLDLSKSRTGWALWRPGMTRAIVGHWVLGSEIATPGQTFLKLQRCLADLHQVEGFERIYLEKPLNPAILSGHTNIDTLRILSGIAAHVHSFACARRLPQPREVDINSWRRDFIGPQKRGTKRATLKSLTMERCRQLGFEPRYDDEADAIGLLDYALELNRIVPPWRAGEVLRPALGAVA
jgi:hypothetical protein